MQPKRDIDRPALLVELMWDKTADGTPRQIKDKKYASWVEGLHRGNPFGGDKL